MFQALQKHLSGYTNFYDIVYFENPAVVFHYIKLKSILDEIWDMNSEIESRVADETNRRLRKKMQLAGADVYIQTVWGYGFKLTRME